MKNAWSRALVLQYPQMSFHWKCFIRALRASASIGPRPSLSRIAVAGWFAERRIIGRISDFS